MHAVEYIVMEKGFDPLIKYEPKTIIKQVTNPGVVMIMDACNFFSDW